jgi:hypothetical protein
MESTIENDFEDKLYSYLRQKNRSTFTRRALAGKLKEMVADPELRKYGRKNLQRILNKMRDDGKVKVTKLQRENYYSFNAPESMYQTKLKFIGKPSTGLDAGVKSPTIGLIIGAIIGGSVGGIIWAYLGGIENWWFIFAGMVIGIGVLIFLYQIFD